MIRVILLILSILSAAHFGLGSDSVAQLPPRGQNQNSTTSGYTLEKKARLRVRGEPVGNFRRVYSTRLLSIKVNVQNMSEVQANGVRVDALSPSGTSYTLNGPANLKPNEQATYTKFMNEVVTNEAKISATATCSNCY